jgi:hypothetical protein
MPFAATVKTCSVCKTNAPLAMPGVSSPGVNTARIDGFLRQLAQDLHAPDLRAVLTEVFGSMRYEGERTIDYFSAVGHALSLVYLTAGPGRDPYGAVAELRRGPDITEEDVTKLRDLYDVVRGPKVVNLQTLFLFSSRKVTGYWRYRDELQILPPPPGAPLPREEMADWPLMLELRFSSPNQSGLILNRRMQAANRLRVLLPVLLVGPVYQPHFDRGVKHWVYPPRSEDQPSPLHASYWAQEGYYFSGWTPNAGSELSSVDGFEAAPIVDDTDGYYRPHGIGVGDVFKVPAVLSQLLDKYFALSEKVAARYRRACYWFCLARFYWNYSISASFFAYVAAIESLLDNLPPHKCPACNAPHHPSITRAFKDFLETHVPDIPERQTFYAMRSRIAHGSTLLGFDIREEFGGFYPGEMDQRSEIDALNQVCRIALVNWLSSQG